MKSDPCHAHSKHQACPLLEVLKFSFSRPTPESLTGVKQSPSSSCRADPATARLFRNHLAPGLWIRCPALSRLPQPASSAREADSSGAGPGRAPNSTRSSLLFAALDRPRPPAAVAPPPPPASSPPLHLVAAPESSRGIGAALLARRVGRPEGVAPRGAESRAAAVERRAEAAYRRPHQRPSPQPNKRASHSARPAACTAQTR